jgi:hypothetical protein
MFHWCVGEWRAVGDERESERERKRLRERLNVRLLLSSDLLSLLVLFPYSPAHYLASSPLPVLVDKADGSCATTRVEKRPALCRAIMAHAADIRRPRWS